MFVLHCGLLDLPSPKMESMCVREELFLCFSSISCLSVKLRHLWKTRIMLQQADTQFSLWTMLCQLVCCVFFVFVESSIHGFSLWEHVWMIFEQKMGRKPKRLRVKHDSHGLCVSVVSLWSSSGQYSCPTCARTDQIHKHQSDGGE